MYTLNFFLEDLIHKTVLLHHWDTLKCLARNSNRIERPTATYFESEYNKHETALRGCGQLVVEWRTRDVLYEQLGGLKTFRQLVIDCLFTLIKL